MGVTLDKPITSLTRFKACSGEIETHASTSDLHPRMCLDAVLTRERRSEPVADLHEMARNPTVRAQANTAHLAARPKRVALGLG